MRIKKYKQNKYIKANDVWVRDLFSNLSPKDINNLLKGEENLILENEILNYKKPNRIISNLNWPNVVIMSDGFQFEEKQNILAELPYKDVKIISTNKALKKWHLLGDSELQRAIDMHVVNNPYNECKVQLPTINYWPNLLASTRTNPKFIDDYKGEVFFYSSSPSEDYHSPFLTEAILDDYRNPVCAAISFAVKMKAKKILLFCCDDSFEKHRDGAIELDNGLWSYPQQIKSQQIIDAQMYWMKDITIKNHSSGISYNNSNYINENQIKEYFLQE